jgi:hypothetical protein
MLLYPVLKIEIQPYLEPYREHLRQGQSYDITAIWKTLIHVAWRAEGAFAIIEGWQQHEKVPTSLRDTYTLAAPRLRDLLEMANDDEADWIWLDMVVKRKLLLNKLSRRWEEPYISRRAKKEGSADGDPSRSPPPPYYE